MNSEAATVIAKGFLKGAFDVFDAMLSLSFRCEITEMKESSAAELGALLSQYPAVMRAKIQSGGAAALMFSVADASRFASLVQGSEAMVKDALSEEDIATLREVAGPCLGGGIANLMERFGRDVEQPEDVAAAVSGPEDAQDLAAFLGDAPTAVSFTFTASPDIDSTAVLLFAQDTEALVPADLTKDSGDADDPAGGAQVSEAEMSDILSGFSPEQEEPTGVEAEEAEKPQGRMIPASSNLERILDIRLVATARLGRIQMPIGEILALGPGSIIEVGHMVDEPVELLVNEKLVARGDVVVVDEKFGIRITEIVSPEERIESMR